MAEWMLTVSGADPRSVKVGDFEVIKLQPDPLNIGYINAYLIVGEEDRVLIETGPSKGFEMLKEQLRGIGIIMEEIKAVVVTHIHLDHAGAAGLVAESCRCPIYVHPKGLKHLRDPSKLNDAAKKVIPKGFEAFGPAVPVKSEYLRDSGDGSKIMLRGGFIEVIHTPGHASHHQTPILRGEGRNIIFPGDGLGDFDPTQGTSLPITPPPTRLSMLIASALRVSYIRPSWVAFTHRGFMKGDKYHSYVHNYIEQVRLWELVAFTRKPSNVEEFLEHLTRLDDNVRRAYGKNEVIDEQIVVSAKGILEYVRES